MKKVLFLLLLLLPITVKADYTITNYRMDITVLETGDINVVEAFKLEGDYNGFKRVVNYKGNFDGYRGEFVKSSNKSYDGSNVILNEVRAIDFDLESTIIDLKEKGDLFNKVSKAKKGNYGVYTVKKTETGSVFNIYNSDKMNKDFYLDYTIENMVINHKDVGEIVLDLFNEFDDFINEIEIYIHIPNNKEMINIWIHEFDYEAVLLDQETIKINAVNVETKQKPYFRLIFDNDIAIGKQDNELVYKKIIEIENKKIPVYKDEEYIKKQENAYNSVINALEKLDRISYNRALSMVNNLKQDDELQIQLLVKLINIEPKIERNEVFKKVSLTSVMFLWLFGLVVIIYQISRKYSTNKNCNKKYSKSLIGYLLKRKVTYNDFIVVVLELINRKVITVKKEPEIKLKRIKSKPMNELEERVVKFLFENKNEVKISELKEQCQINYRHYINSYSNFINSLMKSIDENNFFEDVFVFKIVGFIYTLIGLVIGIFLINFDTYFSSIIIIIIAFLFMIFFITFYKKTKNGLLEYRRYINLKSKLNNFNSINLETIDEDLIYSLSLSCDLNYINLIKLKMVEMNKKEVLYCNKLIEEQMIIKDLIYYLMNNSIEIKKGM